MANDLSVWLRAHQVSDAIISRSVCISTKQGTVEIPVTLDDAGDELAEQLLNLLVEDARAVELDPEVIVI